MEDPTQPQPEHDQPDRDQPNQVSSSAFPAHLRHRFAAASVQTRIMVFSGIGCAIALAILAVIAVSLSRSSAMLRASGHSVNTASLTSKPFIAKPSPIGRAQPPQPQLQSPQPLQLSRPAQQASITPLLRLAPRPPAPPVQQRAAIVAPPAPTHVERPATSLPFGVRMAADRDGFNNGCKHGRLVLEISTVTFTCPHDASKNISITAAEVKSLDNNGIIVFPKQKYHFDITGKERDNVHRLFAEWLENARRSSSARASN